MTKTEYIGARYVPMFADPAEWSNQRSYEALTIVLYEGNSFTSKQYVPVGVDITNAIYWAETGNYNAQVELYRVETVQFRNDINELVENKISLVFDNVAEMAAESLANGQHVKTLGYYNKDDGGGCEYIVSTGITANGIDNIALANGKVASMILSDTINVRQLGAIGDNENSANRDQLVFERAAELIFTYTSAGDDQNGRCVLYIPNGRYRVSGIDLPAGIIVRGDGWQTMIFNNDMYGIKIGGNVTQPSTLVENINFRGGFNQPVSDSLGSLYILNRTEVCVNHCWFGANVGLNIEGSYEVTVFACTFDLCAKPINITDGGTFFISNCCFWGTTDTRIMTISNAKKIHISNSTISSGNGGIEFSGCESVIIQNVSRADKLDGSGTSRNAAVYDFIFGTTIDIVISDYICRRSGGGIINASSCDLIKVSNVIAKYLDGASGGSRGVRFNDCNYIDVDNVTIENSSVEGAFIVFESTALGYRACLRNCFFFGKAATVGGASNGSIYCFNSSGANKKLINCSASPNNEPDSAVALTKFSTLDMYDCSFEGTYVTGQVRTYNNATVNNRVTPIEQG